MQVKVEGPSSSGRAASPTRKATSPSVSAAVPERVSPLTSIRAVRTQFSALESAFKFPPVLDFDHSELAVTSNNAPVRTYELALNGLLERLDAIESDGDEEVRDVRREVVREVERALEEVELKVKEQAPQAPVPEVTKQEASDVEREDRGASASQAVPPAVVHVTEAAQPTLPNPAPVASQADADIDAGVSAEYQPASPVATPSGVVIAERDSATGVTPANGEASTLSDADTEAVPASEDASDSIATITPTPVAPAVPVPSSSNKSASTSAVAAETFLTSLSHDQFTFPPRPAFAQPSTNSGVPHDDDAVLVDNSSEGGSGRSVEDEWTTEF
jgi:BAG domain